MARFAHPLELTKLVILMLALGACGQTNSNEEAGSRGAGGMSTGGSGATGGSGGVGGSDTGDNGGSDATGGSATGGSGGTSACDCINRNVSWGYSGGFVAYVDTSKISPCATFEHSRDTFADALPASCARVLTDCSNSLGISEVTVALNHADVRSALSAAPVLYGYDYRPVDGTVQSIRVDEEEIDVGAPCEGRTDCTEIPEGVQALVDLLWALTEEQLREPPCNEVFPE